MNKVYLLYHKPTDTYFGRKGFTCGDTRWRSPGLKRVPYHGFYTEIKSARAGLTQLIARSSYSTSKLSRSDFEIREFDVALTLSNTFLPLNPTVPSS